MRMLFILALAMLLSFVVIYTVLGVVRLLRLLSRSEAFVFLVTVLVILGMLAALSRVELLPWQLRNSADAGSRAGNRAATYHSDFRASATGQSNYTGDPDAAERGTDGVGHSKQSVGATPQDISSSGKRDNSLGDEADGEAHLQEATETAPSNSADRSEEVANQNQVHRNIAIQTPAKTEEALSRPAPLSGSASASTFPRKPEDWINRQPFLSEDGQTLFWPVVLGPYLEPVQPPTVGQLRRSLSEPWFFWLVEELPVRSSPALQPALTKSRSGETRDRPWERRIRWFAPELWEDLNRAIREAVLLYCKEELGLEKVPNLSADWIAEHLVRDVFGEPFWPPGTGRPLSLEANQGQDDFSAAEPLQFRVHLLLVFDQEARSALTRQIHRLAIHHRVNHLAVVFLAIVGSMAILYGGLRCDSRTGGRYRRRLLAGGLLLWVLFLTLLFRLG
jgi:hypothetical protein